MLFEKCTHKKKRFSWRKRSPIKQARLDFFLVSESLISSTKCVEYENSYRSDHSPVLLSLQVNNFIKGSGFWKFNNSLLSDKEYVDLIKEKMNDVKAQYACPVYNMKNIKSVDNASLCLTICDQLFLDILLTEIRGKTISYSTYKKRTLTKMENDLEKEIQDMEQNLNDEVSDILAEKQKELENIRQSKMKGKAVRARVKWIDEGEKPTKYFCSLESRNYISKQIPRIEKENGLIICKQEEILEELKQFYETLYKKPVVIENENFCRNLDKYGDIPKLTQDESQSIEGMLTEKEVLEFLKKMKNDKTPGPDGFTCEFFKFFWKDIGSFVTRAINNSYEKHTFSECNKLGVITCIPKAGKPKQFLKNWRPISLLNVVYKLASGCIAERIKLYLDKLIHNDQTGFIKGRFIGENIRLIYDIMHYTESRQIPGLLMLIDFEKAFDTVSWKFIQETLCFFNFGISIQNWIKLFYNQIKSCVIQNGIVSQYFSPERGCRQGDPISPYLFLLCAEILGILIRKNKDIKGITIDGEEYKISQYADDTSIILDGSPSSMDGIIRVLDYFAIISGLRINFSKTKMIWIGSKKFSKEVFHHTRWKFEWNNTTFDLLGIKFCIDLKEMVELNYKSRLEEIKKTMLLWKSRSLTPIGRLTVIKTLLIPKLNHLILTIPNPNDEIIQAFERDLYNFLWGGKVHKINKNVIIQDYANGGIKMVDYSKFITALKATWIRRILHSDAKWTKLLSAELEINVEKLWKYGMDYINNLNAKITNSFWIDVFQSWVKTNSTIVRTNPDLSCEHIFYNPGIAVGGKSVFFKSLFELGVVFIYDLLDENGNLYNFDYIQNVLKAKLNFVEYAGLSKAIQQRQASLQDNTGTIRPTLPIIPSTISVFFKDRKGCKEIYKLLISEKKTQIKSIKKWEEYEGGFSELEWKNIFELPFKTTQESKLQWIQFQILHRIFPCNYYLHRIKIIDSPICTFCKMDFETVDHIFVECPHVKEIWYGIEEWFSQTFNRHISFDRQAILFGKFANKNVHKVENLIILIIKQYIYISKFSNVNKLSIEKVKKRITDRIIVEKVLLLKNGRYNEFERHWQNIYDKLD